MIKSVLDLQVFQVSCKMAMDVFNTTRTFPKEERYSLTDQINQIIEIYIGEYREETKVWFLFAKDCGYLSSENFQNFSVGSDSLGARLYKLFETWKSF